MATSQLKNLLYTLKQRFGERAYLHRKENAALDLVTGTQTPAFTRHPIRRAVVLQPTVIQQFQYSLTYISSNKDFVYGGTVEIDDLIVILDKRDLPRDWIINERLDYIAVYDGKYAIVKHVKLKEDIGHILHVRATQNEKPHKDVNAALFQKLTVAQETDNG